MNGSGCVETLSGEKYEGEWSDGYANGPGTYTMKDQTVQKGNWLNGILEGQA